MLGRLNFFKSGLATSAQRINPPASDSSLLRHASTERVRSLTAKCFKLMDISEIDQLNEDELLNSPIYPLGNDPEIIGLPKTFIASYKQVVLVGTGCFRNLEIVLQLAGSKCKIPPKIYIIDNGLGTHEFWKIFKNYFEEVKQKFIELPKDSFHHRAFLTDLEKFLRSNFLESNNHEDAENITFLSKLEDENILTLRYGERDEIVRFFEDLLTRNGNDLEFIVELVCSTVLIRQSWCHDTTFLKMNFIISNIHGDCHVVSYPSNLAAIHNDKKIIDNSFRINPAFVICTDLEIHPENLVSMKLTEDGYPQKVYFLEERNKEALLPEVLYQKLSLKNDSFKKRALSDWKEGMMEAIPYDFLTYDINDLEQIKRLNKVIKAIRFEELNSLDEQYYPYLLYFSKSSLFSAASSGARKVIEYLSNHIDISLPIENKEKNTPINMAAFEGYVNVVEYIFKMNKDVILQPNLLGEGPLHRAAYNFHPAMVELLHSFRPELINAIDIAGDTPIYFAISRDYSSRQLKMVQLLISLGANLSHKNNLGLNPFEYAEIKNNKKIALYILSNFNF